MKKTTLFFVLFSLLFVACNEPTTQRIEKKEVVKSTAPKAKPTQKRENEKRTYFTITTDYGVMKGYLCNETPQHRDNFIKLVNEGFYNDLLFHRVINNFMIQGGDPESKGAAKGVALGNGGPGYTIPAEFDFTLCHTKGALAAARMGDNINPQKASSGSQFYIVDGRKQDKTQLNNIASRAQRSYLPEQVEAYTTVGGTPHLDGGYTVFGQITDGLEVIDKIATVKTSRGDRPVEDVKMQIAIVEEK